MDLVEQLFTEKFGHLFDPQMHDEVESVKLKETTASFKNFVGDILEMINDAIFQNIKEADSDDHDSEDEMALTVMNLVSKTVKRLFNQKIYQHYMPAARQAREQQASTVHAGVACDSCHAYPILGIRYKCSVCGDVDLCEGCEALGVHAEHVLLKIRKPTQAPIRLICQYPRTMSRDVGQNLARMMSCCKK